ncbi:arsenate reductase ArsC [Rhodoligotrophos defluvii]|uniref:arsenate reductase/protein-tyrosine-phosphatase family protein n=1 Tax=Rhodoligotrophos defluvii TaxID=2561934 RepID=UPI00148550A8|nr:arsenate reductase ArsC [Rhodoligotrophos defluvii]
MNPRNILFLCDDNAAGSLMAEAIVNAAGSRHFKAFSAGFEPAAAADPDALDIIAQAGIRARGLRPKSWREFAGPPPMKFHYAVHLGQRKRPELAALDDDSRLLHWPLLDRPIGAGLGSSRKAAFLDLFAEIRQLAESVFLRPARAATAREPIPLPAQQPDRALSRITAEERC